LTFYRIATIPVMIGFLLFPNKFCSLMAAILFSSASITDLLDGFFARRHGTVSDFGRFLDPLADKLLISAALIMLIPMGRVPAWIVFIIVGREIAVTGLRGILASKGIVISASLLAKYKTGFQIAAIIPLLIHYPYLGIHFHVVGKFFLIPAVILTIWSGVDYFTKFFRLTRE